ncbi:MAG TPA: hypothetical protein VFM52_01765 [Rhodanobacter sp.]|nr:hypothetical protein [Rhodanobacter sp.]
MSKHTLALTVVLLLGTVALAAAPATPAYAAEANVKCHLEFTLSGWSIVYKHAEGSGTVRCDNGEHAAVKINVIGGGLTAGKFRIDHGTGDITHVRNIEDVFGSYAQAGAELGVVKSGTAQVLTKGTTSLALAGHGEGINLGVSVGRVTIKRR